MRLPEEKDKSWSYAVIYSRELETIKYLLSQKKEVTFSDKDNYVVIDGKTYNGISRRTIKKLMKGVI